jgi:hypothetical protein
VTVWTRLIPVRQATAATVVRAALGSMPPCSGFLSVVVAVLVAGVVRVVPPVWAVGTAMVVTVVPVAGVASELTARRRSWTVRARTPVGAVTAGPVVSAVMPVEAWATTALVEMGATAVRAELAV